MLATLAFASYAPALRATFVSDDQLAILQNDWVGGPLDPVGIFTRTSWWGAGRADAPGYRPLVTLSFALDREIAGLDAAWVHGLNVLWHTVVSALVFALARMLGGSRESAWIASILFCVLPIHSEAVIWTVGRAELMAAAGFAGALYLVLAYRGDGKQWKMALAGLLFAASLFSKENAVTLLAAPAAAAMLLPAPPGARRRDAIATGMLAAVLVAYLAVRAHAGPVLGSMTGDRLDNPLSVLAFAPRCSAALAVLGRYLVLSLWPYPLSIDYSYDALGIEPGFHGDGYAAVGFLACGALALLAWRSRLRAPLVAYGIALFVLTYSIVSNMVVLIGTAMAERLFYLPSLGLCLAAAPPLEALGRLYHKRVRALLFAAAVAYAAVVFARATEWRSPVSIFSAAAAAYPRSARAQMELGSALGNAGRADEAVEAFRRATAVMPEYAAAWYNFGNFYARSGAFDPAERAYRSAIEHAPLLGPARYNLALILLSSGRTEEAVRTLEPVAGSGSHDVELWMLLADSYLKLERYEDAIRVYDRVLAAKAGETTARAHRARALQNKSGCSAALDEYLLILRSVPAEPTALPQAVACLRTLGREADAERLLDQARVANRGPGR